MKRSANKVRKAVSKVAGEKVGTKRNDRRWLAPDGTEWDSKLEYGVYCEFDKSTRVRKTTKGDTVAFTSPVRSGSCASCGGTEIVKRRHYTPDLFVIPADSKSEADGYYIEVKGYLRPAERTLFRYLYQTNKDLNLRLVFQADHRAAGTKGRISEWFAKFCPNWKFLVWRLEVPKDWK